MSFAGLQQRSVALALPLPLPLSLSLAPALQHLVDVTLSTGVCRATAAHVTNCSSSHSIHHTHTTRCTLPLSLSALHILRTCAISGGRVPHLRPALVPPLQRLAERLLHSRVCGQLDGVLVGPRHHLAAMQLPPMHVEDVLEGLAVGAEGNVEALDAPVVGGHEALDSAPDVDELVGRKYDAGVVEYVGCTHRDVHTHMERWEMGWVCLVADSQGGAFGCGCGCSLVAAGGGDGGAADELGSATDACC